MYNRDKQRPVQQDGDYKCEVCKLMFRKQTDYFSHRKVHFGKCVYECSMCPELKDMSKEECYTHLRIHRWISSVQLPREICVAELIFQSIAIDLDELDISHLPYVPHQLNHVANLAKQLKRKATEVPTKGEKKFKCDYCEKAYVREANLARHRCLSRPSS